jgi:hypothetical protein
VSQSSSGNDLVTLGLASLLAGAALAEAAVAVLSTLFARVAVGVNEGGAGREVIR